MSQYRNFTIYEEYKSGVRKATLARKNTITRGRIAQIIEKEHQKEEWCKKHGKQYPTYLFSAKPDATITPQEQSSIKPLIIPVATNGEATILRSNVEIQDACETLKEYVHNQAVDTLIHKIYTIKAGGVEIGYRRKAYRTFMRREVFIRVPGYKIEDLSKRERSAIMTAVFNVFTIPGSSMPEIEQIARDCLLIRQDMIPLIPVERSPGLVSIAGGFG